MKNRRGLILTILIYVLTFIAGFLNGMFFITAGTAVSHHTGNITRIALTLSQGSAMEAVAILLLIGSFHIGGCISGIVFYNKDCILSKRCSILLLIFSAVFLVIAVTGPSLRFVLPIICGILGIQNGLFISHNGTLVRTAHFSGYLTDAGIALGKALCGDRQEIRHCVHYLSGVAYFAAGAAVSAFIPVFLFFYVSAFLYFFTALFHFTFRSVLAR